MRTDSENYSYRQIKDGAKYDRFFPKADLKRTLKIDNPLTEETVNFMRANVGKWAHQSAAIAKHQDLTGRNLDQTLEKIWNFSYWHFQYALDTDGIEEIRTPARAWHDRFEGIDCDCFAFLISTILTNKGIAHSFRIAKYNSNNWQHIYIIAHGKNRDYILDPVLHTYNQEKPPTQYKDFPVMELQVLSGVDGVYEFGAAKAAPKPKPVVKKNTIPAKAANLVKKKPQPKNPAPKTAAPKAQSGPKTAAQQKKVSAVKTALNKAKAVVKNVVNNPGKAIVKYSPIIALSRNGFYLFLRVFRKKITSKIEPAVRYTSTASAAAAGISASDYAKATKVYNQLKSLVIDKLQGDIKVLNNVILGKDKGVSGLGESENLFADWEYVDMTALQNLDGLGDLGDPTGGAATAGAIAAAAPVIIKFLDFLKDAGLIGKDVNNSDILKELTNNPDVDAALRTEETALLSEEGAKDGDVPLNIDPTTKSGLVDTFMEYAKANPLITTAAAAALGYGIYSYWTPKKASSPMKSVSGFFGFGSTSRKRKKRKTTTKLKTVELM